jgi:hypothetical protein
MRRAALGPSAPPSIPPSAPRARARAQVWVKPTAEMQYLYGNHVLKSGLGRITEATPAYTGVVVYSMTDVPLGAVLRPPACPPAAPDACGFA